MYLITVFHVFAFAVLRSHAGVSKDPQMKKGLYQGDMLLTQYQTNLLNQRKAYGYLGARWPAGSDGNVVVPFVFTPGNTTSLMRSVVRDGLKVWENATCVSFKEFPSLPNSTDHLSIGMRESGCFAQLGRVGGAQRLNIGRGCETVGIVAHETAHALGLQHEQSRSDRDEYIKILYENVESGHEYAYDKINTINYVEYDYASLMHYGGDGFSKNGKDTLRTLDPLYQELIRQGDNATFMDFKTVNLHYQCPDAFKCGEDTCKNKGYLGKRCTCVCPPGTSGDMCETKTDEYTDAMMKLLQPNSGRVTSEGEFTSPGYPEFPIRSGFIQVIESKEECEEVEVTVKDLDLPACGQAELFITETGDTFGVTPLCGSSSFKQVLRGPRIVFTYKSHTSSHPAVKGYRGSVKFVPISECVKTTASPSTTVPPSGITIINTGSKVQLELAENECNFKIQKTGPKIYQLYTTISGSESSVRCRIPLSTVEPRVLKLVQVIGLAGNTVTTEFDSMWDNETILSSNVDLIYSGSNPLLTETTVKITVELVNYECQKVIIIHDTASGVVSMGNTPCEVWFEAAAGRTINYRVERTLTSLAWPECDTSGYVWLSAAQDHSFDYSYKYCANEYFYGSYTWNLFAMRSVNTNPDFAPMTVKYQVS